MTTRLLVVRHAVAADASPGQTDAARPLTPEGRKEFQRAVKGLKRARIRVDRIYHSPLLRAVQTADLLVPILEGGETIVTPLLAEPPSEALLASIAGERPALVGHQPWLGELTAWLVLGAREAGEHFPFAKGGVARLEGTLAPGGMALKDLWTPETLRRM